MDNSRANLCCVLKMHTGCHACKMQTIEVLNSIDGVYDVTIDAEAKTAKISGQVDPTYCIKALARCGVHAELLWANISHPRTSRRIYGYDYDTSSYYDQPYGYGYGYGYRRSLPEGIWHDVPRPHPTWNSLPEYSYHNNSYYNVARHIPSYSYPSYNSYNSNYDPYYDDGSINLCSIM